MARQLQKFRIVGLVLICLLHNCSDDDAVLATQSNFEIFSITTLGGSNNDSGRAVVSTQDGGYAMVGFTQSNDGDISNKTDTSFDYWLLKFSAEDVLEWERHYGGTLDERAQDVIETTDGGFAILGSSASNDGDLVNNAGLNDYWLLKVDATGSIQWQKTFGFSGSDSGISIISTSDNGFLVSGILDVTASGGQGNSFRTSTRHAGGDYWVLKLDSLGELQWSQYFGGNFTDTPEGAVETEDGGYIIVGGSDSVDTDISSNIGSYDFWIIKLSASGQLIWEKSFGGNQIDEARGIIATDDGNYVIAGDTRSADNDVSSNKGGADLWLIKISTSGNLIWEQTFGGSNFDVARDISLDNEGNFLLVGSSRSSDGDVAANQGQNDAWILTINANGSLIREQSIGGTNIDFAYGVTQLADGSIIAVGDTASTDGDITENKGFSDALIIKLN